MKRKQIISIAIVLVLLITLLPLQAHAAELPFTDVAGSAWYYGDVKDAYETGLINGVTETTFAPDSDLTYAQAVKLAACMYQKYTTGSVTLRNGTPCWYDSYVAYAKENGIITRDYDWDSSSTRAGYAEIIANALPDEALQEKNRIADGYIPDVGVTHPQGAAIYKLYRAGILTGRDALGTFRPDSNIKRSEVSAILTRMMHEDARRELTLAPETDEKALDILINRYELEGLGELEGTIYVTGHKSPDSDTVCCSIAYANLLRKLGYDAVPAVLGKLNSETKYILQLAGVDTPELLEDAAGKNMVLVDHSEYSQSANGLNDAHIVSIIDHHGVGSVTTGNPIIYDARPVGSTASIVWIRYRNYGVELDQKTALLLLGAILSDTNNLKSVTTTAVDLEAAKALRGLAGDPDVEAMYQEMYKASISYDGMSDEDIFLSDYKEYEYGGKKFSIGCVNAYDEQTARELAERMKNTVPSTLPKTGMDMAFAQISVFHDDLSITFIVPGDDTAKDVILAAFQDKAEYTVTYDGTSFRVEPSLSRKTVLVPAIKDVLEKHSGEK